MRWFRTLSEKISINFLGKYFTIGVQFLTILNLVVLNWDLPRWLFKVPCLLFVISIPILYLTIRTADLGAAQPAQKVIIPDHYRKNFKRSKHPFLTYSQRIKILFTIAVGLCMAAVIMRNRTGVYIRDGTRYKTVNIGTLKWTENLRYKQDSGSWCFENNPNNCNQYGALYSWASVQKVCNGLGEGWRLPSKSEIIELGEYLSEDENQEDFRSMLGGELSPPNNFLYQGRIGIVWSGEESKNDYVWILYLYGDSHKVDVLYHGGKEHGYSCRCVKNLNPK